MVPKYCDGHLLGKESFRHRWSLGCSAWVLMRCGRSFVYIYQSGHIVEVSGTASRLGSSQRPPRLAYAMSEGLFNCKLFRWCASERILSCSPLISCREDNDNYLSRAVHMSGKTIRVVFASRGRAEGTPSQSVNPNDSRESLEDYQAIASGPLLTQRPVGVVYPAPGSC